MGSEIKGAYLYYRDIESADSRTGIDMKVAGQIKAFNSAELNCRFQYCPQTESLIGKVASSLPLLSDGVDWPDPAIFRDDSYIYIRRPRFASKELIAFLKNVKRINGDCFIVYELPNYPYDREMQIPLLYCAWLKDRRNRRFLSEVVDRIALIQREIPESVFGIPCVSFINGVDMERFAPTRPVPDINEMNIFFAAYTLKGDRRYGTDRLLKGLADYYRRGGRRRVRAHLAIGGGGAADVERQIHELSLGDKVEFYGEVPWDKLSCITDKCSIAMAPLGLHRVGSTMSSALKTREYLAKGLPFFFSGEMDIFESRTEEFCLEIPADETPVSIDRLLEFHDSLYEKYGQQRLIDTIRDYAKKTVSVEVAMGKVVECVKSNCDK